VKLPIPAPKWLSGTPKDGGITEAIGSGPYKLVEYVRASHFLLQANPDYAGPKKPTINEINIVFRNEAVVRAGMLKAGEVQLATLLTPEAAKEMPSSMIELTGESVGIKINHEHPVLKDLRVRQAINMAFDRKSMIDALYGEVAEPLHGMLGRKSSFGWNPNVQDYPYDPAKAKQLIQEAGAVGQSITLIGRNGVIPRVDEVTELFANQVNQTGLKVTVQSMEVSQWRTANRQVKSGEPRPDILFIVSSDPVLDSSRTFIAYFMCGGIMSLWCDQEWTAKLNNVMGLSGEPRSKGLQELWATARDQNVVIPLFGLNFVHGMTPKLHWGEPRRDLLRIFSEWTLDD
jgi:peptide/nickel transport system substrate-binding protein